MLLIINVSTYNAMNQLQDKELSEILRHNCKHLLSLGMSHSNPKQMIQKVISLGEQLRENNNKQSDYCKRQLEKDKNAQLDDKKYDLLELQQLDIPPLQCYWTKQTSEHSSIEYTYLKVGTRVYMFNSAFIIKNNPEHEHTKVDQITFILSQAPIQHILSYVKLCLHLNTLVQCFMPTQLWSRVQGVLEVIWGTNGIELLKKSYLNLCESEKPIQFYYGGSSILFYRNLWKWDSYNVYISLKGCKYLIKCPGLQNNETIYGAWRKSVISEVEYCRLVDKATKDGVVWGEKGSQKLYSIKEQCQYYLSSAQLTYRIYASCQLLIGVPREIVGELYASGEIKQYACKQVIYKSGMNLDKFYIILQGIVNIVPSRAHLDSQLGPSSAFTVASLIEDVRQENATLIVQTKEALLFSIDVWKALYILGHQTQYIRQVSQNNVGPELAQMRVSDWVKKLIKIDAGNSAGLSESLTKQLTFASAKLKISTRLWHILCSKDLRILFMTKRCVQ